MGAPIIEVKGISKKYRIGHRENYLSLRDSLTKIIKKPLNLLRGSSDTGVANDEFWALKDVSFNVEQGEVIGIIGRNGAGKTTMLKILSRITYPTKGEIHIRGRVASLLEVGTGFHPELTGRENIYFNGSILGMKKREIDKKFDEIVAFSEIEKFIDTPAKRYSSGMYLRLAFAVAAHLEPEILVIDEVLAVGDAAFQKKCLGKIGDVAKEGRTVLFVSHNMNAVEHLCRRALLLESGIIREYDDDVRSVIKDYLFGSESVGDKSEWINTKKVLENPWFTPKRLYISDAEGNQRNGSFSNDSEIWVNIEGEITQTDSSLQVGYSILTDDGNLLYWTCHTDMREDEWPMLGKGCYAFRSQIPKRFLNEGTYRIELIAALYFKQWICQPGENSPVIYLTIQGGLSESRYMMTKRPGILAPTLIWQCRNINS